MPRRVNLSYSGARRNYFASSKCRPHGQLDIAVFSILGVKMHYVIANWLWCGFN